MSGILDRRSRRFVGSESNERVLTARVARDDINRGEKIQGKMLLMMSYLNFIV